MILFILDKYDKNCPAYISITNCLEYLENNILITDVNSYCNYINNKDITFCMRVYNEDEILIDSLLKLKTNYNDENIIHIYKSYKRQCLFKPINLDDNGFIDDNPFKLVFFDISTYLFKFDFIKKYNLN